MTKSEKNKKTNIPELRFPEFENKLIKRKLGEFGVFLKGKSISKSDIFKNGKLECIRYGELYTTYGEVIEKIFSRTNLDKNSLTLSDYNDIIIPASGETNLDIATASCVLKDNVALGGDINIIKTSENGIFISYYLNNKKKINIARIAQGVSVVHLYAKQLKTLSIFFPSLPEQKKIASFLSAVDKKIQQLTRKKELLEQYKKGVMQKIFSQEIRFPEFNGKLNEIKLGKFISIKSGNSPSDYVFIDGGKYPFLKVDELNNCEKYQVESRYYSNNKKNLIEKNSVIFPKRGAAILKNKVRINSKQVLMDSNLMAIKPKNNSLNHEYLYYKIYMEKLYKIADTSTIPQINNKHIFPYKISLPIIPEQKKIASFLSNIDKKINSIQTQLTKTRKFKKGLLQQMFV